MDQKDMLAYKKLKIRITKTIKIILIIVIIVSYILLPLVISPLSSGAKGFGRVVYYCLFPAFFYLSANNLSYVLTGYTTIIAYQFENGCYKLNEHIGRISGIVIHTASEKTPFLNRFVDLEDELGKTEKNNHWNKKGAPLMPHGFIGLNKRKEIIVINTVSYDISTRICGKGINGSYDKGYIHITICDGLEYDKDYFNEAVFGAAVQYCARLCRKFSLISEQIITDKTAYDLGYASQYSDFEIWLTANGKTIDDFRKAVRKLRRKEWLLFDGGLGKNEYKEEKERYLLENPTFVFLREFRKLIFIAFKELFAKK